MTHDPLNPTPAIRIAAAARPSLRTRLLRLFRDDSGQDMIEYALFATFMGLSSVAGIHGLAASVSGYMNTILGAFNSATGPTF